MFWRLSRRSVLMACMLLLLSPVLAPAQGCGCGPGPADFLPDAAELGQGFVVINTVTHDRAELAATFADPQDAAIRLDAWWWSGQATRTYERGSLGVEVSAHMFVTSAGPTLALPWFARQRAESLGLNWDGPPHTASRDPGVSYQAVSGVRADGLSEYTLYRQHGQVIIRVSVTSPLDAQSELAVLAFSLMQNVPSF